MSERQRCPRCNGVLHLSVFGYWLQCWDCWYATSTEKEPDDG